MNPELSQSLTNFRALNKAKIDGCIGYGKMWRRGITIIVLQVFKKDKKRGDVNKMTCDVQKTIDSEKRHTSKLPCFTVSRSVDSPSS